MPYRKKWPPLVSSPPQSRRSIPFLAFIEYLILYHKENITTTSARKSTTSWGKVSISGWPTHISHSQKFRLQLHVLSLTTETMHPFFHHSPFFCQFLFIAHCAVQLFLPEKKISRHIFILCRATKTYPMQGNNDWSKKQFLLLISNFLKQFTIEEHERENE